MQLQLHPYVGGTCLFSQLDRFWSSPIALVELQSPLGDRPLDISVVCPQNGTAGPKRVIDISVGLCAREREKGLVCAFWFGQIRALFWDCGDIVGLFLFCDSYFCQVAVFGPTWSSSESRCYSHLIAVCRGVCFLTIFFLFGFCSG